MLEESLADTFDLEVELERQESLELLDRAMSLLPEDTRAALVKRYVDKSTLAEVAAQLGTNTSAAAMRIQRGKLALRRVLTKRMQHEIAAYGITGEHMWEETRLWCTICGRHRLLGQIAPERGGFTLRCPHCCTDADMVYSQFGHLQTLEGVKSYKVALTKATIWFEHFYHTVIQQGTIECSECGKPMVAHKFGPDDAPTWIASSSKYGLCVSCSHCRNYATTFLDHFAHRSQAGQHFIQRHPRIITLPERIVEVDGHTAAVTRIESVIDSAWLDVVLSLDTYKILQVHGEHGEQA